MSWTADLIFVTILTNQVCGEKSFIWRNFKFLYIPYVKKSKSICNVEEFLHLTNVEKSEILHNCHVEKFEIYPQNRRVEFQISPHLSRGDI